MSWYTDVFDNRHNKETIFLKECLGKTTCHFIGDDLRPLYIDALAIYNLSLSDNEFSTKLNHLYYLLMPLTCAVEATLFKLADELNINYSQDITIGVVFDKQHIDTLCDRISNNKRRKVVEEQLGYLGGFIQEYRNNPVHNGLELTLSNKRQLENKVAAIMDRIKSLIESLEKAGLINVRPFNRPALGSADNWG